LELLLLWLLKDVRPAPQQSELQLRQQLLSLWLTAACLVWLLRVLWLLVPSLHLIPLLHW
jgi:hypothetical protein